MSQYHTPNDKTSVGDDFKVARADQRIYGNQCEASGQQKSGGCRADVDSLTTHMCILPIQQQTESKYNLAIGILQKLVFSREK